MPTNRIWVHNTKPYSSNKEKDIKIYSYYNKPGHTIEVCFKKNGFPPYLKKTNIANLYVDDKDQVTPSSTNGEIAEHMDYSGFTPDQQKELMDLLHAFTSTANIHQLTFSFNHTSGIPQSIPSFKNDIHDL